ncbi:MAG TPA: TIGR01777 family oxidoreductase [Tepidisphaeraceae bacterium]|nr:TIGR01777 family oxidoreductase [Tepidisphaeraceae bacterium]
MRILITGSSGLLARHLMPRLRAASHEVVRLLRPEGSSVVDFAAIRPDLDSTDPQPDLDGFDAVINLAGSNIGRRWTKNVREEVVRSRVEYTAKLCRALARVAHPPARFLSASGIGYYGYDKTGQILTESSPPGTGFVVDVCRQWEDATRHLPPQTSITIMRIAPVLAVDGPVLGKLTPLFRKGLGGVMSHGRQVMAWIALPDFLRAVEFLVAQPADAVTGPFNVCAPNPITNREFTRALAKSLHRPAFFRVPKLALKLAFGQMATETVLADQRAIPQRLLDSGFTFTVPTVETTLSTLTPTP